MQKNAKKHLTNELKRTIIGSYFYFFRQYGRSEKHYEKIIHKSLLPDARNSTSRTRIRILQ